MVDDSNTSDDNLMDEKMGSLLRTKNVGVILLCALVVIVISAGVEYASFFNHAQNSLTVESPDGSGSTNPAIGVYQHTQGSSVQVSAAPSSGWQFSHWLLDGVDSGSTNPTTVMMNSVHTLEAVFTQIQPTNGLYFGTHSRAEVLANPAKYADYIIYRSGSTYYAKAGVNGPITSSGSNAKTVIESTFRNSRIIYLESGTYVISDNYGILLNGFSDLTLIGASGTILKKAEVGIVGQVLEVMGSRNVYVYGVVFDQDRNNPNHQSPPTFGATWIVREGADSENIWFESCKFLNGEEVGFVSGNSAKLHLVDCVIDNVGEHPLYLSMTTGVYVENCQIYNWAKLCRGYGPKLVGCSQVNFTVCSWEPNRDGLGYPGSGPFNDYGVYGPVIVACNNVTFIANIWQGDPDNPSTIAVFIDLQPSNNIIFKRCQFFYFGRVFSPENHVEFIECYIG